MYDNLFYMKHHRKYACIWRVRGKKNSETLLHIVLGRWINRMWTRCEQTPTAHAYTEMKRTNKQQSKWIHGEKRACIIHLLWCMLIEIAFTRSVGGPHPHSLFMNKHITFAFTQQACRQSASQASSPSFYVMLNLHIIPVFTFCKNNLTQPFTRNTVQFWHWLLPRLHQRQEKINDFCIYV